MRNFKKQNFIEKTKAEFQQYSEIPITDDVAIEIQQNLFGFLDLLIEWETQKERKAQNE